MNWIAVEKAEITHYLFAASPINSMTFEAESFGFPSIRYGGIEYIKGKGHYCFPKDLFEKTGKIYLKKIIENPKSLDKVNKEINFYAGLLFNFCQGLSEKDFSRCSDKELADLYDKFEFLHNQAHARRGIVWIMETCYSLFSNYLTNYLDKEIKKQKLDLVAGVVFAVLATPLKKNYPAREKEDFLKIALELKSQSNTTEELIKTRLKDHVKEYRWLPYGLSGPAWDAQHFVNAMQEMLKKDKETIEKELDVVLNQPDSIRKQKQEILSKLKFDEKHKKLIKIAEDSIYSKAYSKDVLFFAYYSAEKLLNEIAKRLGINITLLRRILPWEISPALLEKGVDKENLEERYKYSFHFIEKGKSKVFVGEEAKEFVKGLNLKREHEVEGDVNELKGNCARQGFAKGKVKIINSPKDLSKMNQGDILVSHMTDPEIVVAMQKASAIVTDMGGITCHAAIISRELDIPCVIGTRIATKVLKDDDMVEVDAVNGIIRRVK